MTTTTGNPYTVFLTGRDRTVFDETAVTDAAVKPGMFLARTATGARPQNVAAAAAPPLVATEATIFEGTIETEIPVGARVQFGNASGCHIYAILASGANVAAGAKLTFNNAGKLVAIGVDEYWAATALEAVNASGADARIRVEVV
jgi:hypothetical protein